MFKVCATVILNTFNNTETMMTIHLEWRPQPLVVGGATGLVVGAVVGTVMTFLVGRHLPHEEARDRAALVGMLATTFVLAIALAYMVPVYVLALPVLALGMLCAGPLCLWLAGTRPFRSDVS